MITSLSDLLAQVYQVETFTLVNRDASSVGTTASRIIRNREGRVALLVVNLSTNRVYLSPDNDVSDSKGIRLEQNGGFWQVDFRTDLSLPSQEIWAVADGASSNLFILETMLRGGH